MDYPTLLTHLTALKTNHSPLGEFQPVTIHYAEPICFDNPSDLLEALTELGEVTGWMTWPDAVERIEQPKILLANAPQPPIEGELVTNDKQYLRIQYRNQHWQWIRITLTTVDKAEDTHLANALMDSLTLSAREANTSGLVYQRIWQLDEQQGVIAKDAIFTGFAGEKQ